MAIAIDQRSDLRVSLFMNVLSSAGEARLAVAGASMLPSIWPGDILEIHRVAPPDIFKGDVVVFTRENRLIAHRVVQRRNIGDSFLITRGDRSENADSPVLPHELLGKVAVIRRGRRQIAPHATHFKKIASWLLCRSELCTRLLLRLALIRRNSPAPETAWAN